MGKLWEQDGAAVDSKEGVVLPLRLPNRKDVAPESQGGRDHEGRQARDIRFSLPSIFTPSASTNLP
jgi:hypothetical protein